MPKKGEIYKHYKGNVYRVLNVAKHTEELVDLVIYQDMSDESKIWARPLDIFEEVLDNGIPRFELVR